MKRQIKCWDLDIKLSIPECARVQKSVLAISICNNNCSALFLGAILLQIVILIVSQSHLLSFHCFKSFVKYIRWQIINFLLLPGKFGYYWWRFWWSWEIVWDVWQRQRWNHQPKGNSDGFKMPWHENFFRTGLDNKLWKFTAFIFFSNKPFS